MPNAARPEAGPYPLQHSVALASAGAAELNPPLFCMDPGTQPLRSRFALWLALIVAVFAAVRWVGMSCDLWLDEIWSLGLVREIKAPWEILTKVLHDNNHPLNSLWLSWLPAVGPAWTYRLLAWCTGSATVLLAGLIARRQYRALHPESASGAADAAGLFTAVLIGGAHLLVHYSSEARGYAPAVAGGLLAWYALSHAAGRTAGRWAVVYGFACVLGLLSHLVMVPVMAAALVWSALAMVRDRSRWQAGLKRLAVWHAVPWLFFGFYYGGFVRRLSIGGGPENPLAGVLGDVAAFTLGFPPESGRMLALPVLLGVAVLALVWIWRRDWTLGVFYGLAAFILPAAGPALGRFTLLFPRYFIVSAVLVLLLAGYVLARLWARGGVWRWATLGLVALFLAGNGLHTYRLGRDGRGQYQAALRRLVAQTPATVVSVGSDSDFRNSPLIGYHAAATGLGRKIRYFPADRVPRAGTQWLIIHRLDGGEVPPGAVGDPRGNRYELEKVFPHAPLSGWDWYVYRRR